jgi:glycosyltransferase involved in cell wall biosynthesis
MITGKSPKHEAFARIAVQCFIDQSYANRELVIINDGAYMPDAYVLDIKHPLVREILIDHGEPAPDAMRTSRRRLGELRNIGLENAKGQYIIQWDDDDFHHIHRIMVQMAHRETTENRRNGRQECAVVLRRQMRVNLVRGNAHNIEDSNGIAGTILHPNDHTAKYPDAEKSEDSEFLKPYQHRLVMIDNDSDSWPGPALYVRLFHGGNTWDEEHVMGEGSSTGRWELNETEAEYLQHVLASYGVKVNIA